MERTVPRMTQVITALMVNEARQALLPPHSVRTLTDCLSAVERLGFLWPFTPGTGEVPALFPALDTDLEGQRWDWVWGWKDTLSATRQAFYGKVTGGKPTLVAREWLPVFYALTGNTGDPAEDLIHLGEAQRVHELAPKVCHYLEVHGPTGTRTLQAALTDGTRPMKRALEKALEQLDTGLIIVKAGAEGGNSIANVWDLFPRFWPDATEAGTAIPTREAAVRLVRHLFLLTPAISERRLARLFPWSERHVTMAIARLREAGELEACLLDGKPGLARAGFGVSG